MQAGEKKTSSVPDSSVHRRAFAAFEAFGVELEYMIVDAESLDVRPVADRLMAEVAGDFVAEVEFGPLAWSNELALHVLELKTNGPARTLEGLGAGFHDEVRRANDALAGMGCRLLPGGMHPWMDPHRETRLWPHEYNQVYRAFDRIFSCRGHGWANLQSTHLNLPFQGDREFAALHAAIRVLLPILPALSASSPILDGRAGGRLDERLTAYRTNAARVPSVAGVVVPEPSVSRRHYEDGILEGIYRDLEPLDPEGILRHEWVNARGAIARFQRGSIEIRILDSQECPAADVAMLALIARVVEVICSVALDDPAPLNELDTRRLAGILDAVIRDGDLAVIRDRSYLEAVGVTDRSPALAARELWSALAETHAPRVIGAVEWQPALEVILDRGPLARRILEAAGAAPSRDRLAEVYRQLARCLEHNEPFTGLGPKRG
jgi:glutamate---cysteine ligase / carboxylate-amine ligase